MRRCKVYLIVLFALAPLNLLFSETSFPDYTTGDKVFITATSLLGFGFDALALSALTFGPEPTPQFLGGYALSGTASFFTPYFYCRYNDITENSAWLYFYGGLAGIGEGASLCFTLLSGIKSDDEKAKLRVFSAFALSGSSLLSAAGLYYADPLQIYTDDAHFIGLNAVYGYLAGLGLSASLGGDMFSHGLTAMLLSTATAAGSYYLTRQTHISGGDLGWIYTMTLTGASFPLYFLSATNGNQLPLFLSVLGSAVGFATGYYMTLGRDFSDSSMLLPLITTTAFSILFLSLFTITPDITYTKVIIGGSCYLTLCLINYLSYQGILFDTAIENTYYHNSTANGQPSDVPLYIAGGAFLGTVLYSLLPKTPQNLKLEFNPTAVFNEFEDKGYFYSSPFLKIAIQF